jgi:hypothetical protein
MHEENRQVIEKECFSKDFKIKSKNTVLNKIATSKAKQLSYLRFYKGYTVISSRWSPPPLTQEN